MILYSIIPQEVVFGGNTDSAARTMTEMDYMGERVQVSALTNNRFVIQRLISTKPQAYLNPNLQPGTIIYSAPKGT